jgi:hypothetical protein
VDMHGAEKRRFGPLDYHKNKIENMSLCPVNTELRRRSAAFMLPLLIIVH